MKTLHLFLVVLHAVASYLPAQSQDSFTTARVCLSGEEEKLYTMINDYRKSKGLKSIPLSRSLTYVAQQHCRDLSENRPDQGNCNLHSWSAKGDWSECCYTDDHAKSKCMWDKPSELTDYDSNGYEISHSLGSSNTNASTALNGWKRSYGHNQVILNRGVWGQVKWNAVGVAIYKNYSVVWFGTEEDPAGKAEICHTSAN